MTQADAAFAGSIPELYETHLVPLIFEHYADDLVARVRARQPKDVLEIAAGTGVVTRRLAGALPQARIVATDLNQAMLDQAAKVGTPRPVEWRQADAMKLPFADASFDAVVIQFGVMFFPDKAAAHAEARRVLRPGGVLLFNLWDSLRDNELAGACHDALAKLFPQDPPGFLARTPYAYHDRARIATDLAAGGFTRAPRIDVVTARSRAPSAERVGVAYCQSTPLRAEIEARGNLADATQATTAALVAKFGRGAIDAKMQALVVTAER